METYPIDLEASQIVRWLLDEQKRGRLQFAVTVTRSYLAETFEKADLSQISDEDAMDLNGVVAVGRLEVRPRDGNRGWVLKIRVENRLGPRLPDDEDAPDDEEDIDLETFQADFIAPDPDATDVFLGADNAEAKASFIELLDRMLRNEHEG